MALFKKILPLFCLFFQCAFATQTLKKGDIRETFDEMLGFHVEHSAMSPLLLQRSIKIYLEQFDPSKMYLLEEEAKAIQKVSNERLQEGVDRFKKEEYVDFVEVNKMALRAVLRARQWRQEVEKEFILSAQEAYPMRGEAYLSYAQTEQQLKARLRKQLIRVLMEEKVQNGMAEWSPSDREKIFALWEKRFQRFETPYLSQEEREEHYLALHTLRALAKSLDAHTAYFSPEEAFEMRTSLEKQFEGVGVVLRESIDGIYIAGLVSGGPAERSGEIQKGDKIIRIDEQSVEGLTYEEILKAMKGDGKKELHLTLKPREGKVREVLLLREKIMMNEERLQYTSHPVADGHIGILTLPSFYEGGHQSSAERDMRDAIKKLKKEGNLKGVILDMRENAGGFLTQSVKVSGLFVSQGVIVISKYSRGEIKYLRNLDGRLHYDGPLIILTSRASASAAEIVAQALQDYGTAIIVGDEQTYGKGSIQYQTVTDRDAKAYYKVTVGRYYTVSGRSTQIEGVKADIVVPTVFSSYKIGERYLEYPLESDQVTAAYVDPLTDIDYRSRAWFQKNYLPNLHKPQDKWQKLLPILQENSRQRLENDQNFATFVKAQEKVRGRSPRSFKRVSNPPWGNQDLQMNEAVNIMKDMVALN